jgi:tetratricopeptide (TPR) repeat protein
LPTRTRSKGKKLNVDAVLEGTIQQADGRIRINARLLKVENGEQIWAENFDLPEREIFALQDALSKKIVQTLAFELTKPELADHPTKNVDAYQKYLRGRFYQSQNTEQGLTKAIQSYQQAIALDAGFAEPYAGIADANLILYNFGLRPAAEIFPLARKNLERAFQLNPNMPDAYNSLAMIQLFGERDWRAAEQSLQKAIDLDPNNASAFLRYGYFLINVGNFDEALVKLSRARELNPLSPLVEADIGMAHLLTKHYPQAIEQLEKTVAENPDFPMAYWFLGATYQESGDEEKAFAANLHGLETEGSTDLANRMRNVREVEGLEAANNLWLNELLRERKNGQASASALDIALLYARKKDREQTLAWLEKAAEEDARVLVVIKFLARYDFVRDEERFRKILEKIEFKK